MATKSAKCFFFISLVYSLFLASLPIDVFLDRDNYLIYAESSFEIFLRYFDGGGLTALANEPVWLAFNVFIGFFLGPEYTLRVIILLSAFVSFYVVLRSNKRQWLLVVFVLLSPQVLKNDVIHLRQGLALSFFLVGWYAKGYKTKAFFIGLAPFIHASFFFIGFIMVVTYALRYFRFSQGVRTVAAALIGFSLSFGLAHVASFFGARQAIEYIDVSANVSGLAFVFWACVAVLFIAEGRSFSEKYSLEINVIIFYLSTYFFIPVTARIFESAILLVLLAGLQLTGWRRWVFLSAFVFYFVFSYLPRLSQPMLGWAYAGS